MALPPDLTEGRIFFHISQCEPMFYSLMGVGLSRGQDCVFRSCLHNAFPSPLSNEARQLLHSINSHASHCCKSLVSACLKVAGKNPGGEKKDWNREATLPSVFLPDGIILAFPICVAKAGPLVSLWIYLYHKNFFPIPSQDSPFWWKGRMKIKLFIAL